MDLTHYGIMRKTQRGIRTNDVALLLTYGKPEKAKGGATKIILTRKTIADIIAVKKRDIQSLSSLSGLTAVVEGDNILTLYKA